MQLTKERIAIALVLALTFGVTLLAWPSMPDPVASHWGVSGEVNGYLPKFWGLLLVPFLSAGLAALLLLVPRIDPLRGNIEEFREAYERFIVVFLLYMLAVQAFILLWNYGIQVSISMVLSPAFAALFYEIGVLIGQAKPNWTIGIRTRWTLSSPVVWEKTHALGGKLFRLVGILALLGVFFPSHAIFFILVPVLAVSFFLVYHSYREYEKEQAARLKGER
ncbi:MAG TPA: SdpI family protein [Methanomicrobiales archaeon]|nr:SdpI family protein [Methanomicrobiales archaeon]